MGAPNENDGLEPLEQWEIAGSIDLEGYHDDTGSVEFICAGLLPFSLYRIRFRAENDAGVSRIWKTFIMQIDAPPPTKDCTAKTTQMGPFSQASTIMRTSPAVPATPGPPRIVKMQCGSLTDSIVHLEWDHDRTPGVDSSSWNGSLIDAYEMQMRAVP